MCAHTNNIYTVRPSGAKRTTISSVQRRSYIEMGPKMADKADPSQELSITVGARHCCRIVGWKRVAFSKLSQFTSPFGIIDSLLLRDRSTTGNAATPSNAILCDALLALRVKVTALQGSLHGILEAFFDRFGNAFLSEIHYTVASLVGIPLACGSHNR